VNAEIEQMGDGGFARLNARNNPDLLAAGELQVSENLRLDRGVARTRLGARRRGDLIAGAPVLTLDFTLGADIPLVSVVRAGSLATVTTSAPHGAELSDVVNLSGTGIAAYDDDFYVTGVLSTTRLTVVVVGAPGNSGAVGNLRLDPLLGTGPLTTPLRAAGRFVNAFVAGRPEYVVLAAEEFALAYQDADPVTLQVAYPAGETVDSDDDVTLLQAANRMYLLRAPVESGVWASFAIEGITRVGTTARVSAPGHWLVVGNRVRISGALEAGWNHEFDVTGVTPSAFSFEVAGAPTSPAGVYAARLEALRVKPPLYWDGVAPAFVRTVTGSHPLGPTYARMPGSSAVAVYFNNMLGVARSADEWWLSDVLDPDTFDPFSKSFRTGGGGADYIVAGHAFADRDLIVFCRYSVWRVRAVLDASGTELNASASFVALVTSEIGCCARRSVATVRNFVYFLSDAGVYRIDPNFTEQRLTEQTLLLSDPVKPITDRIDWTAAAGACGVFHDARYWLLVSLVPGADIAWPVTAYQTGGTVADAEERYCGIHYDTAVEFAGPESDPVTFSAPTAGSYGSLEVVAYDRRGVRVWSRHTAVADGATAELVVSPSEFVRYSPCENATPGEAWCGCPDLDVPARVNTILVYSLLNEGWESLDIYGALDGVDLVVARSANRERLFCASANVGLIYLLEDRADGDDAATGRWRRRSWAGRGRGAIRGVRTRDGFWS